MDPSSFWHILITDLETPLFELKLAIQMIMQNSQLHAVGRTQTGAKQLAPVILAVWKLNGNTHGRVSGSVDWWRGCCSPRNSWTSHKNQAPMEVKMIRPNPSQIAVFWVASSHQP